ICKTIRRDLFECSVLCLRRSGPLQDELAEQGIEVMCLARGSEKPDRLAFLKVARILRRQRIDVIHTHNTEPLIDGTMGAILAGVKTIVHTDHARRFPDKHRYMVAENILSNFIYRMIGVSEDTSHNLRYFEKISPRRLMTIPNGIDPAPYVERVDHAKIRQTLGVPRWAPLIGTVARLSGEKAIDKAIEAFAIVSHTIPEARFIIVGEGPCESELRTKTRELGLQEKVIFAGRHSKVAPILAIMDLFVLSSTREGLPMAVLEAMAAGCPVVAFAVGGVPSAVEHARSGYLVAPGDIKGMAGQIEMLLQHPVLARGFGEYGRRLFARRFSAEPMTRAYERLYMRNAVMVDS
ncbi:MAG: glycosyltransferase, partial [Chitinivibrionales bacterium]